MNTITSMDQLPTGTRAVQVPPAELRRVHDMATRDDPATMAALAEYRRLMPSRTLKLDAADLRGAAVFDEVRERYWRDVQDSISEHEFMFGFCPYVVTTHSVEDCAVDPTWEAPPPPPPSSSSSGGGGDAAAAAAEEMDPRPEQPPPPGPPVLAALAVPVIPAFGTYDVYVLRNSDYQTRVITVPRGGWRSAQGPAAAQTPIQTLFFDAKRLPDLETGALHSRCAALLDGYDALRTARRRADAADYARARPITFLQHDLKGFNVADAFTDEVFADHVARGIQQENATYKISRFGSNELATEVDRLVGRQRGAMNAAAAESAARGRPVEPRYSIEDALFVVPPTLVVAPQPPLPDPPARLGTLRVEHYEEVATQFRIPRSFLLPGPPPTHEERRDFADAVEDRRAAVLHSLDLLFAWLMPGAPARDRFSLRSAAAGVVWPPQPPAAPKPAAAPAPAAAAKRAKVRDDDDASSVSSAGSGSAASTGAGDARTKTKKRRVAKRAKAERADAAKAKTVEAKTKAKRVRTK